MIARTANVVIAEGRLIAELSDGRELARPGVRAMADALFDAGIAADAVTYHWRAGLCMITAGQRAALCGELRRLEQEADALSEAV